MRDNGTWVPGKQAARPLALQAPEASGSLMGLKAEKSAGRMATVATIARVGARDDTDAGRIPEKSLYVCGAQPWTYGRKRSAVAATARARYPFAGLTERPQMT
jgi:hypothetical protein